jgi:hypothetical protein
MKKLATLIILLIISSTAFAWPWNGTPLSGPLAKPTPQPALVVVQPFSQNPINDARTLVRELNGELKIAKIENTKLKSNLDQANGDLKTSFILIEQLNKDIANLKEWGVVQQAEAQKWLSSYTNAIKRYHRLKNIAAAVAGLFGMIVGIWLMGFVPPMYSTYALLLPVAGAGIAASALWIFL